MKLTRYEKSVDAWFTLEFPYIMENAARIFQYINYTIKSKPISHKNAMKFYKLKAIFSLFLLDNNYLVHCAEHKLDNGKKSYIWYFKINNFRSSFHIPFPAPNKYIHNDPKEIVWYNSYQRNLPYNSNIIDNIKIVDVFINRLLSNKQFRKYHAFLNDLTPND